MVHFKRALKGGRVVYRCFCGQEATCTESAWEAGIRSCKCAGTEIEFPTFNLMGKRFGLLLVFSWQGQTSGNVNLWRCRCKCGERTTFNTMELVNGEVKDCGCVARRAATARQIKAAAAREKRTATAALRAEMAAKKAAKNAKNAAARAAVEKAKAEADRLRQAEIERLRSYADEQARAREAEIAAREAARLAEQQRAEQLDARQRDEAAKILRIFKLTATAHTRPRASHGADSFPRAGVVALAMGEHDVTYRCYCGQQTVCSRQAWDAGVTTCACRRRLFTYVRGQRLATQRLLSWTRQSWATGIAAFISPPQPVQLPYYDLRGETIGDLTLQRWTHAEPASRGRLNHHYEAICSCGNTAEVTSIAFTREGHRMCGKCYYRRYYAAKVDPLQFPMPAPAALDLSGKRLGKLTIVGPVTEKGHTLWQVGCECGHQGTAATADLLTGRVRSCGVCEEEQAAQQAVDPRERDTQEVLARLQRPHAKLVKLGPRKVAYKCFCGERASCSREEWEHGIHACTCDKFTDRYPLLDLHGLQVGKLIVRNWAGLTNPPKARQQQWECKCGCGNLVTVLETELLKRQRTSCGCLPAPDTQNQAPRRRRGRPPRSSQPELVGQVFGALTALGRSSSGRGKVQCRCSCGSYVEVSDTALRGGKVTSCGCQPAPAATPGRHPVVVRIAPPEAANAGA